MTGFNWMKNTAGLQRRAGGKGKSVDLKQNPLPDSENNWGSSLLHYIAQTKANQVESRPLFDPAFIKQHPELRETLDQSNFPLLRKKMARQASLKGKKVMFFVPFKDSYIFDVADYIEHTGTGSIISSVKFAFTENVVLEGVEYPLSGQFFRNPDNSVTLTKYVEILSEEQPQNKNEEPVFDTRVVEEIIYEPMKGFPASVFVANEDGVSDIDFANLRASTDSLNFLSNEINREAILTATKITHNENFSDETPKQVIDGIYKGDKFVKNTGYNSKLQTGQEIFTSGSQAGTFLQLNINFVEDYILKYVGIQRESTSTGSNKQTLEITLMNQFATEMLFSLRDQREDTYKRLFSSLFEAMDKSVSEIEDNLELKVSLIEEAKIAMLNEKVEQLKNKGSMSNQRPNRLEGEK